MTDARPTVGVMARRPDAGRVKTRLAAEIGERGTLGLYRRLLEKTLTDLEGIEGVRRVLCVEGLDAGPDGIARPAWELLAQRGDTLGGRLAAALTDLFADGAAGVILVASDSPGLPADYLRAALRSLAATGQDADERPAARVVIGPAADGGYYLIGCGQTTWASHGPQLASLLTRSPMSTASLFRDTVGAASRIGLTVIQLPLWVDVDTADDVAVAERLLADAPGRPAGRGLREVCLHLTHRCARACRHCYERGAAGPTAGVAEEEMTSEEWRSAIDQCIGLGAASFVFIGGDPLLRDDFVDLVEHAAVARRARVRFFFNRRIAPEVVKRLARVGGERLRPLASIDGPREIDDALRGAGSHDDVMVSVARLLDAGLEPIANTVLVRPALPGLPQLARELRAAGLNRLHLILPHQRGAAEWPGLAPSGEELLAAMRELLGVADEIGLVVDNIPGWRRRLRADHDFCAAGCQDLAIDPYGTVHACVVTAGDPAFAAGSLREHPLEDIWRASGSLRLLRAARARDRAECRACPVLDACGGDCWAQAHYAAVAAGRPGGYRAAFPYCDLLRPIFLELRAEAEASAACEAAACVAGSAKDAAGCAGGGQSAAGAADYALFDCI